MAAISLSTTDGHLTSGLLVSIGMSAQALVAFNRFRVGAGADVPSDSVFIAGVHFTTLARGGNLLSSFGLKLDPVGA